MAAVSHVSAVPHVGVVSHVAPSAVSHVNPNVAAQRGDWNRHFEGNRGWNGFYYHHPWIYVPNAYSIYPYTYGWGLGSGDYNYGDYGYGSYAAPTYYAYNVYPDNGDQVSSGPLAAAYSDSYPPTADYEPEAARPPAAESTSQFYAQALTAFSAGNYEEAIRLADHALVDAPKDARTHELLSLAMFAQGDYRGAAIEAHPAISLGPIGNWATIQTYYNNPDTYTTQLRALESYVVSHSTAADAHFLLGYQYLMLGHADEAKYQFQAAHQLTPDDALAAKLAGS
jgi:tetratricopeptide (TPR) repeat protein